MSIGAKLVADLLSVAGIDRLITMDLHADQIQGFFDIPVDHLYASTIFAPYIQSLNLEDLVIATPDVGGSKRASTYAKYLDVPLVLCHKTREKANVVASMQIIGDVKDKNVILIETWWIQLVPSPSCRHHERSRCTLCTRYRFSLCNVWPGF